jgi:hypothetical protein
MPETPSRHSGTGLVDFQPVRRKLVSNLAEWPAKGKIDESH